MGTLNKLKSVIARNDLLLRGIIPLVAYSSWMLPSILQNSMIFIGCSVSALYALSDIKQWFKRAYYHFIEPQTQHFREGLVDITLMSIQLYLSIIQSTGMAHHFISKKSIFFRNFKNRLCFICIPTYKINTIFKPCSCS